MHGRPRGRGRGLGVTNSHGTQKVPTELADVSLFKSHTYDKLFPQTFNCSISDFVSTTKKKNNCLNQLTKSVVQPREWTFAALNPKKDFGITTQSKFISLNAWWWHQLFFSFITTFNNKILFILTISTTKLLIK